MTQTLTLFCRLLYFLCLPERWGEVVIWEGFWRVGTRILAQFTGWRCGRVVGAMLVTRAVAGFKPRLCARLFQKPLGTWLPSEMWKVKVIPHLSSALAGSGWITNRHFDKQVQITAGKAIGCHNHVKMTVKDPPISSRVMCNLNQADWSPTMNRRKAMEDHLSCMTVPAYTTDRLPLYYWGTPTVLLTDSHCTTDGLLLYYWRTPTVTAGLLL